MRRFILTVLVPIGDMVATASTLLMLNGLIWIVATVYLLPGIPAVEDLALVYCVMVLAALPLLTGYVVGLTALALTYRVPLGLIFIHPEGRSQYLKEATA